MSQIKQKLRRLVLASYQVEEELEEAVELTGDKFERTASVKRIRNHLTALQEAAEDCKEQYIYEQRKVKP